MDGRLAEQLLGGPEGRAMLNRPALQGGVTLIEVLVAIAIVAMVLGLAAPSMRTWIQNTQIRSGAESILGGIKQARFEAISRNTTVAFELQDANSVKWHVCFFDTVADTCQTAQPDIAVGAPEGAQNATVGVETAFTSYTNPLGSGVNVPSLVAFDSFGRVSPQSATNIVRLEVRNAYLSASDERRLDVSIGPSGRIVMCDPALPSANPQSCPTTP